MKKRILFLIFMSGPLAICQAEELLIMPTASGTKFVSVSNVDGYRISTFCLQKRKPCLAQKAIKNFRTPEIEVGIDGFVKSPGSLACHKLKGEGIILQDFGLNQSQFCLFSDKSFVSMGELLDSASF